jgi:membrane-bound metal-dependent hydrolase YbcI (DUF457 family)
MGIGHFAVGFAAKRAAPRVSLGLLLLSGMFVDLLWVVFIAAGVEHARIVPGITAANAFDLYDYPITHSLIGSLGWAALFGAIYFAYRRERAAALVLGAGVASHWILDVVAHRPDVPVLPRGPYLGLGLWYSLPATILVEGTLLLAGVAVYARATRGLDRIGTWGLVALVGLFLVIHVAGYLGPPPPSLNAVVATTPPFLALTLVAAHVIDRHRDTP